MVSSFHGDRGAKTTFLFLHGVFIKYATLYTHRNIQFPYWVGKRFYKLYLIRNHLTSTYFVNQSYTWSKGGNFVVAHAFYSSGLKVIRFLLRLTCLFKELRGNTTNHIIKKFYLKLKAATFNSFLYLEMCQIPLKILCSWWINNNLIGWFEKTILLRVWVFYCNIFERVYLYASIVVAFYNTL